MEGFKLYTEVGCVVVGGVVGVVVMEWCWQRGGELDVRLGLICGGLAKEVDVWLEWCKGK